MYARKLTALSYLPSDLTVYPTRNKGDLTFGADYVTIAMNLTYPERGE